MGARDIVRTVSPSPPRLSDLEHSGSPPRSEGEPRAKRQKEEEEEFERFYDSYFYDRYSKYQDSDSSDGDNELPGSNGTPPKRKSPRPWAQETVVTLTARTATPTTISINPSANRSAVNTAHPAAENPEPRQPFDQPWRYPLPTPESGFLDSSEYDG